MMENFPKRPVYKYLLLICLAITVCGIIFVGYFCSDQICTFNNPSYSRYHNLNKLGLTRVIGDNMGKPVSFLSHPLTSSSRTKLSFDDMVKETDFEFDIKGNDVMVFLHIQKTGGTEFGMHLVKNLDLEEPCQCKQGRKKCKCFRPDSERYWLFSRYSTGWKCGLHADWTELTNCVDTAMDKTDRESAKRRYFYVTLLRDPVSRFLSEYRHVQRGATWKTAKHICGGRAPTQEELPPCYYGENWTDVTLEEYMGCHSNLAINRQTRMLADLTLVGCYNTSLMPKHEREVVMLASAKQNLQKMAFFGLCEFQKISQYLFENTFHLQFLHPFVQYNDTFSSLTLNEISPEDLIRIKQLNNLDLELYDFAKSLLFKRYKEIKRFNSEIDDISSQSSANTNHIDRLFDVSLS